MSADIREHLAGLSTAFSEGNTLAAPDCDICCGDEFPSEFRKLTDQWRKCVTAASVINARYYADWNKGGALTVIAPKVREVARGVRGLHQPDSRRRRPDPMRCGVREPVKGRRGRRFEPSTPATATAIRCLTEK